MIFVAIFNSCKKDSTEKKDSATTQKVYDQLSESQLLILDSAPLDTITKFNNLLFPDGRNIFQWGLINDSGFVVTFSRTHRILTPSDKKDLFIKRMSEAGCKLTDDTQCSCYPTQPNGLAYVYGSKYTISPYLHPDAICRQFLYGLDCSGMIYQMAVGSKLNLPVGGTVDYINPSVWNKAFNSSFDFQGLEMKDQFQLPASQLQAGDIIIAPDVHMGMVYSDGITLGIFNSQGSYKYTCDENSDTGRGPVKRTDIQRWLGQLFPNNDYHVLRVFLNGTPGLITNNITSIGQDSAAGGGNITNQGSSPVTVRGVCWSTTPTPTILNSKTTNGSGIGVFTSTITGLIGNTKYYVRAYATNNEGTAYGNEVIFLTHYEEVTIGTQVWMSKDLDVTTYRNGDIMPKVEDPTAWDALTSGAWCWLGNDSSRLSVYGKEYNWFAVADPRGLAPKGWHIPTYAEWITLVNFLGGDQVAGGAMKETGTTHWISPNIGATNSSGFNGIPGGLRYGGNGVGTWGLFGYVGFYWSSTKYDSTKVRGISLYALNASVNIYDAYNKQYGLSIRCIKD